MQAEFPTAVPEIPVNEMAQAVAYYQSQLGFALDWGGEELGLAGISKGSCRIFLASQEYRKGYGNAGPALIWLNLESNDEVAELHRTWSASGVKMLSAPEPKPWGLFEFTAADLDGNLFRVFHDFGTSQRASNA